MRAIERQFSSEKISDSSIARHAKNHLSQSLVAVAQSEEKNHLADLLARIERMTSECETIIELAKDRGDYALTLKAINQLRHVSGLLAQVAGVVQTGSKTLVLHNERHTHLADSSTRVIEDVERFSALLQEMADAGVLPEPRRSLPLSPEPVEDAGDGRIIELHPRPETTG